MNYVVYWLISENKKYTYVGSSDNIERRVKEHRNKKVESTKKFGKFKCYILEHLKSLEEARYREKYWKSGAGRRKLKNYYSKLCS